MRGSRGREVSFLKPKTIEENFTARYEVSDDGCWLWTGTIGPQGYAQGAFKTKPYKAHRLSYELHIGPIPDKMFVMQTCEKYHCVNPDHFYLSDKKRFPIRYCDIEACNEIHSGHGYCKEHAYRFTEYGDPFYVPIPLTPLERFNLYHDKDSDGCWYWNKGLDKDGYGSIKVEDIKYRAHRWSYQEFKGDIPPGIEIDHECRHRSCVNPDHLRLATNKENQENRAFLSRVSQSGYRGVSPNGDGRWRAYAAHNKKTYFNGVFDDPYEAALAAQELRNRLFTHNAEDRKDGTK